MKTKDAADVVIVGAGAAGLFTALSLAPRRVTVLGDKPLGGICASCWAQGGIAAAVGQDDTAENHAIDTLKAAAGTADIDAVRVLTGEAPHYMSVLEKYGVKFARDESGVLHLSREACHDRRRVLHAAAGDGFGYELMRALVDAVCQTPSITYVAGVTAERILRADGDDKGAVTGVLARYIDSGAPVIFASPAVVLATGGIGGLYAATTNPLGAVGRGVAMAARAGAVLSDLEFVQFHPTALDIGEDPAPLATEALRGEGAYLVNDRGERFMTAVHEMAELAPRDIVSRGIFSEQKRGSKVYLDCRHIDVAHFPALVTACARAGINAQTDLVPVMPAVHYHMGGIATDLQGRSSIDGLWACGEVAATGLHGANRLASNSLMEAIVMGGRVAADIANTHLSAVGVKYVPLVRQTENRADDRQRLRRLMTDFVGVVRDKDGLDAALADITAISLAANADDSALADMALVAGLITSFALARTESRGGHCRADYPVSDQAWAKRSFATLLENNKLAEMQEAA